jgi:hypothetical protein
MQETEFHKPFLRSLIVIALGTVFLMFFSTKIIQNYSNISKKPQEYTTQQSYDVENRASVK